MFNFTTSQYDIHEILVISILYIFFTYFPKINLAICQPNLPRRKLHTVSLNSEQTQNFRKRTWKQQSF